MKYAVVVALSFILFFYILPPEKVNKKIIKNKSPKIEIEKKIIRDLQANTYEDAIKLSKKNEVDIFLYVGASWCKPCRMMKQDTFENQMIKEKLCKYITCILDEENNNELVKKLKIKAYPSYFIINSSSVITKAGSGYLDVDNFLSWLNNL